MLRTFDFAVKGAANKSAQGIALGGVGIAVGVTRRSRGARRGSPDPDLLPDRQVSRAHRRPRFQRSSCLLSLRQNEGDLSVKHLGGVRRPAPSAGPIGQAFGRGQETWLFYTSRSLVLVILGGAARIAVSEVDTRKEDWSKE